MLLRRPSHPARTRPSSGSAGNLHTNKALFAQGVCRHSWQMTPGRPRHTRSHWNSGPCHCEGSLHTSMDPFSRDGRMCSSPRRPNLRKLPRHWMWQIQSVPPPRNSCSIELQQKSSSHNELSRDSEASPSQRRSWPNP